MVESEIPPNKSNTSLLETKHIKNCWTSVRISYEDKLYCYEHGLSFSFLLRQAIEAHKIQSKLSNITDDIIKLIGENNKK